MDDSRVFCKYCQYKLAGLAHNVCPECGKPFDPDRRHSFTRHPRMFRSLRRVAFYLLAVAAAYIGSYYCLVRALPFITLGSGASQVTFVRMSMDSRGLVGEVAPTYLVGGSYVSSVYSPLHTLDRKLRPHTWLVVLPFQTGPLEWAGM